MDFVKIDNIVIDNFLVVDSSNNPITGLVTGDFTIKLYNPSNTEVSSSITVTVTELGSGLYRSSFTPNVKGNWLLVLYHATYFAEGKSNDYECVDALFDDVQLILGLVQQNFRITSPAYDANHLLTSATIKIYANAINCNADTNPIATYSILATYNSDKEATSYKVVKN